VTSPAAVRAVADSYVKAGSDVILTNTLCANRFMLAAHAWPRASRTGGGWR